MPDCEALFLEVVVKKQIEVLARIQEKDRELEELRLEVQQGPERIQINEQEVKGFELRLDADKNRIEEIEKCQKQYEREVEDGIERIKKSKNRLLSIKNNKEYQAVLKEIDEMDKAIKGKEEKILGCMEEREKLQERFEEKTKDLSTIRKQVEKAVEAIQTELDHARAKILKEEKDRADMVEDLDAEILNVYERLRTRKGGIVVSQVVNATCCGCNMNIPPQMYNELQRRDSLKFCPNCERIIYWKNGDGMMVQAMSEQAKRSRVSSDA